ALEEDIEWAIGLNADLHQFMQLVPLPGTPLYDRYRAEGKLEDPVPYTRMSGQDRLIFRHPHFDADEAAAITRRAFRRKYEAGGPGVLNMAATTLTGYERARADLRARTDAGLSWNPDTLRYERNGASGEDSFFARRVEELHTRAREFIPILWPARLFAPNRAARRKAAAVQARYRRVFGPFDRTTQLKSAFLTASAAVEHARTAGGRRELIRQPPMRRIVY
ncbi:MAG: hypothetical protein JW951_04330, partial [Lentisphaerae bacterium]|nr:hypothetical protein [Lentisphaerota bacterium]